MHHAFHQQQQHQQRINPAPVGGPVPGLGARAAYLLGMGPLPPPRPQELAAAYALAGLNAGQFPGQAPPLGDQQQNGAPQPDQAQGVAAPPRANGGYYVPIEPGTCISGPFGPMQKLTNSSEEEISVLVPVNTTVEGAQVTFVAFKIVSTLPPLAFLNEVRRLMGIEPTQNVRLGYRVSPCKVSEPFIRFETEDDVAQACVSVLTRMKRAVSRTVQLEVNNLVRALDCILCVCDSLGLILGLQSDKCGSGG